MESYDGFVAMGITKILVVDDKEENIAAAKVYIGKSAPKEIKFEYAKSAAEAMLKIEAAFASSERFRLVVSDLEMEKPESGMEVVQCGIEHLALGFIATGRIATPEAEAHGHGSAVTVMPSEQGAIKGTKDKPETWAYVFSAISSHLQFQGEMRPKVRMFLSSMERFSRYRKGEKMPAELVKVAMRLYAR